MSKDNSLTIDEKFTIRLIQEIIEDVYQYHTNNTDFERFGTLADTVNPLNEKNVSFLKEHFKHDFHQIETLYGHLKGLTSLYDSLVDQNSKDLLLKIVAFRLLGKDRVKLPLNNPDYWRKREYVKSLIKGNETISIRFKKWTLSFFKLDEINYPIQMFSIPAGICNRFIIKSYEYDNSKTIIKAAKDDFVIDAGGCWGDTALYFAHEVGNNGKVYTFEFVPDNIEIMETNINLNPNLKDRIEIINKPVWYKSGETLYFLDNGPGSTVRTEKPTDEYVPIPTISIDDFVDQNKLQKVDFIKMDIEGAELNALKGAINTLKRFKPKLAICLYHNLNDFTTIPCFISSLNLGYDFYLGHYSIHSEETVLFATNSKIMGK